jgi:HPt (histidine-containing phosphotransfer) domain-containing protein
LADSILREILDVAALERQTGGDAGLRAEIVRMFLEDCPQRLDDIGAAIATGDLPALSSSSHALKGSAAYLKAATVRECAAELERCAREGRIGDAPAGFDRLRTAVEALLPELQKLTCT